MAISPVKTGEVSGKPGPTDSVTEKKPPAFAQASARLVRNEVLQKVGKGETVG
jgi:hypothetical protein